MVCFFSSITIGILISGVFGFGLSLVVKNGFRFCPDNNAMFVLSNAFGEGLLVTPMGFTMGLLGYKSLIVEIAFFATVTLMAFSLAMSSMEDDKNEYKVLYEEENQQDHGNSEQIAEGEEIT
jgi:predicted permease